MRTFAGCCASESRGQRLYLKIAADMRLPIATVRSWLAELSATGAVVMCTLTRYQGDNTIKARECRLSGYAREPEPGRKAQAQKGR